MKTIIFADLHFGTANNQNENTLTPWIKGVVERHAPQRIVLAGDIFELILPIDHQNSIVHKTMPVILESILATWRELFNYWNESGVQEFIFLVGEHDYEIDQEFLVVTLQEHLPAKKVVARELYYDEESKTLVLHGHQFDYNRIFKIGSQKISCIDGLTVAINNFVSQTPEIEKRVRAAAEKGSFSYWYAFGKLPGYIRAAQRIFAADPAVYVTDCAKVLRGGDLDKWLAQQSDWQTKVAGQLVKIVALLPPALLWFYSFFFRLLDLKTKSRMRKVLLGESYTDEPSNLKNYKGLQNLITGHFHDPCQRKYGSRTLYNISSPRLHTGKIKDGRLETFRDLDYIIVDGKQISFVHERKFNRIRISGDNFLL